MMRAGEGEDAGADVLLFKSLDAEPRRGRLGERARRRPRRVEPGHVAPDPVPISRVTVIASDAFEDERAAHAWLESCRDARGSARELEYAMRRVNRAVHALVVVFSHLLHAYGTGDELVEGAWREAWTVPADARQRRGRRAFLAPQEQVALILSGRKPAQPSEDVLLRARLDLNERRSRQAALQARAAHDALQAELQAEEGTEQLVAALRDSGELMSRLAATARERALDAEQTIELEELVAEMERIARRRRHA